MRSKSKMHRKYEANLTRHQKMVEKTDRFSKQDVQPILLGLFGEVGSIMSAIKKLQREAKAFDGYKKQVVEEFGDAFWYLSALSMRLDESMESLIFNVCNEHNISIGSISPVDSDKPITLPALGEGNRYGSELINIGNATAALLESSGHSASEQKRLIKTFLRSFFLLMAECGVCFNHVLDTNTEKVDFRFGNMPNHRLPAFDDAFPEHEQLPAEFRIEVRQRDNGRVYTTMNEVLIGNALTDNISQEDWFRYHDVIHLAHAAILHWSPTFRGLLKRKRKSCPTTDENQDGGRAIVVEEGLTALVFSKAKELDYFRNLNGVSYDLLKTIQEFVKGYEVEQCPLWLWESCIIQGYKVFLEVKENGGGVIIGDRGNRTLKCERLCRDKQQN